MQTHFILMQRFVQMCMRHERSIEIFLYDSAIKTFLSLKSVNLRADRHDYDNPAALPSFIEMVNVLVY